jgi:hypothetical protein
MPVVGRLLLPTTLADGIPGIPDFLGLGIPGVGIWDMADVSRWLSLNYLNCTNF